MDLREWGSDGREVELDITNFDVEQFEISKNLLRIAISNENRDDYFKKRSLIISITEKQFIELNKALQIAGWIPFRD